MCAAVHSLASDPQLQEDDKAGLSSFEVILQGTYLRDILLSSFMTRSEESQEVKQEPVSPPGLFYNDQRIQSWARRYSVSNTPVVVEGDPLVEGLNPTQRRAVAHMIGERVSLVQGVRFRSHSIIYFSRGYFPCSLPVQEKQRRLLRLLDS